MHRYLIVLFSSIVVLIASAPLAVQPPPRQAPGANAPLGLAGVAEVRAFRAAKTLADWRRTHPRDTVGPVEPGTRGTRGAGTWAGRRVAVAVTATGEGSPAGGGPMKQTVYFYAPRLSSPLPIPPPDVTAAALLDQVVPGCLWIDVTVPDEKAAASLVAEATRLLNLELGAGQANAKVSAWGAGSWRNTVLWEAGDFELAVGTTTDPTRAGAAPIRVVVAASRPASELSLAYPQRSAARPAENASQMRNAERTDRLKRHVEEALALARVGGAAEAAMRALLPYVAPDVFFDTRPAGDPAKLLAVFRDWMAAIVAIEPPRRAAALLVADQVLQGAVHPFKLAERNEPAATTSKTMREAVGALGAQFQYLELGGTWMYKNTWLKEAATLDSDGRAGELVFLTLLEKGFETSGGCADQHGEGFTAVISKGEAYLNGKRGQTSPDRGGVLYAVAQAYSDIVGLGSGMGYDGAGGSEQTKFKADVSRARQQALHYYRLALATEVNTERAKEAWAEVWRLTAGLPPSRTYFYCVYD